MRKKKKATKSYQNLIIKWLNSRSGRLDIYSIIIAIITVLVFNYFNGNIQAQIYVSFFFFTSISVLSGSIIIDLYLKYFRNKDKKKTRVFEFLFFVFLFFSTLFATLMTQYTGKIESADQYLNFIQFNWLWMCSFGLAFVFGYYHYVVKVDD